MYRFWDARATYISGWPLYVSASTLRGTMYVIIPYCIVSS